MTKIEEYAAGYDIAPENIHIENPANSTKFKVGTLIVGLISSGLFIAGVALLCTGSLTTGSILMIVGGVVFFLDIGLVARTTKFNRHMIEDITAFLDKYPNPQHALMVQSRDKKWIFYAIPKDGQLKITYESQEKIDNFHHEIPKAVLPRRHRSSDTEI